ncbi:transcriptional regulator [Oceanicola granulosus HTCC2516]|uniref:Transcriptional regulator n=1 Tax=Oceanicola granulosus (strain ATCC BAA-861 / DSM 15982 / KCTC 12143 / HTCC2516) TaxID=314256 RepID=Q2CC44_OCEGH|nr:LysR family transcriptional regulator [Oceanicola granulosus]EAR50237.1 transcriptional regulator [Oceanicola granulosus HTCC2516]
MKITGTELHHFAIFDSVVRNSGFSAAQAELGLSQPTISNHITALEERLGVRLCQRGRGGFVLTEEGRIVHELGQSLLGELESHGSKLAALRGGLVGRVRLAVVDCLATDPHFRLPDAVRGFRALAPAVQVELTVERPQDILSGIHDNSFDIGIGGFDRLLSGLEHKVLYHERHSLYCGRAHPLFEAGEVAEAELGAHPWVHRRYWSKRRQRRRSLSESDAFVQEIEAQIIMVLSGTYLGLLPDHAAAAHVARGELRALPFQGPDGDVTIDVVTRSGPQPEAVELLRAEVLARHA